MAKLGDLAHIGVYVSNTHRSVQFYTNVLGFERFSECELEENGNPVKLAFLRNGNLILELIEFAKPIHRGDGIVDHFAITSEDIETICENLKSKGIVFETKEIGYAANVLENGCKGIFFRGPDNERIEIVEPVSKIS
ncbi:MAG: VOC family protein [Treponema sp.]|jgi:lactoylglutathione lyase|nr:VOC family protein [Treponema sp.]